MINYLIESSVCMLAMLLLYRLLLAKTSLHQVKRGFLVLCLVVPLGLPLASVEVYYEPAAVETAGNASPHWIGISPVEENVSSTSPSVDQATLPMIEASTAGKPFDWIALMIALYLAITGFFLVRLAINIGRIRRLADRSEQKYRKSYRLVLLDKVASPYSFFRYIFMGKSDFEEPDLKQHLLSHELVHVKQWHSLDILLLELCKSIFWYNPMYWSLSKSIRLNHEFIADAGVIANADNRQSYQHMLLQFYQRPKVSSPLVSPSDYSFIKNRFQMMQKTTNKKTAALRLILLIPVMGGILFSFAMDLKPKPKADSNNTETTTTTTPPTGFPVAGVKTQYANFRNQLNDAFLESIKMASPYPGIDVSSHSGRTVIATGEGEVTEVGYADETYGNYVLIKHNATFQTLYASLAQVDVKKGDLVKREQQLGTIGISMKTSTPGKVSKVHYAVSKNGNWVNPHKYFDTPTKKVTPFDPYVKSGKPDILPFDVNQGEYMAFTGSAPKHTPKISSVYDTAIGTEFFSLPATLIRTTAPGTVSEVVKDHEWYGNYVKVKHDDVYETMYAKLDEINVTVGQSLAKGENLGSIGNSDDMYGRFHYKIMKEGKSVWADMDLYSKMSSGPGYLYVKQVKQPDKKYGIKGYSIPWTFPKGYAFKDIFISKEKAVFVKHSGEAIIKTANELSREQKAALLSFRSRPFNTYSKRRPVPEEVYSRWEKPWVYKITIDGEYIESEKMVNYKPEDFAHCSWVVVSKNVKKRNGYAFELWLSTEEYYKKNEANKRKQNQEWKTLTKERLALFKDL